MSQQEKCSKQRIRGRNMLCTFERHLDQQLQYCENGESRGESMRVMLGIGDFTLNVMGSHCGKLSW